MTEDDIISIAQEVYGSAATDQEYQFARLVAGAERKKCADLVLNLTCMGDAKECFETAAAYIRARGQHDT